MHTAKWEPHTRKGSRDRRGEQGTQGILSQRSPGGFRGGRGHRRVGKAGALCLGVRPALPGVGSQSVVCGDRSYCGQGSPQSSQVVKGQEFRWSTGSWLPLAQSSRCRGLWVEWSPDTNPSARCVGYPWVPKPADNREGSCSHNT